MMPRLAEENKEDDEVSLQRPSLVVNQSAFDGESTVINQTSTTVATTGNTVTTRSNRREGEDPSSLDACKKITRKTTGLQHAPGSYEEQQQVNNHVSSKQTIRKKGGDSSQMVGGSPSSTASDYCTKKTFNRLELAPGDHNASSNSSTEAFSHRGASISIDLDSRKKEIVQENEGSDDGLLFPGVVRVGKNHDDSALRESETHTTQGKPPSDYVIAAEVVPNTDDVERENERLREELRRQQGEPVVTAKVVNDDEDNATFFSRWWKCIAVALLVLVGGAVGTALALSSPTTQPTPPPPTPQPTPPPPTPQPTPPPPTPQLTPPPPTPVPQNPLLFRSAFDTSQCLTIFSSNPSNFDLVYPDTCGQGSNQEFFFSNGYWVFNSDTDWCIEGDSAFTGEEIFVFFSCSIDRWTYENDCTIRNNGEGTCLTWSGLNSLTLETCQGLTEQRWLSSSESACTP